MDIRFRLSGGGKSSWLELMSSKTLRTSLCTLTALASLGGTLHAEPVVAAVDAAIQPFIDSREISGAVTLVADGKNILHLSATGMADVEKSKPMKTDSIFWIASMTKPVTGTAAMMMHEEGLISMDDPVAKYLPEFRYLKDAGGNDVTITIKECLTHTSGLSDVTPEETQGVTTLEKLTPVIALKPVKFKPGSKWEYNQSGINTVGRIVEVVSGKSFPEFLQERLFGPLGMKDTSFYPTQEQVERLANTYTTTEDHKLKKAELEFLRGKSPSAKDRYPLANGGLFSTAEDYSKFARMILNGGEWNGKRYLKAASVKEMTTVKTGDLVTGFTPGNGWGLGWCITPKPQGVTEALSPGTFGHGGKYGTQAWIDPAKKLVYIMMIQRENIGNGDASEMRHHFQNAAAELARTQP